MIGQVPAEEEFWQGSMQRHEQHHRQFIATLALQGILAGGEPLSFRECAQKAVALADALMAELAKPKEKATT